MKQANETRKQIRLNFQIGMVVLHAADIPPLACSLEDLSAGGCRCLVPIKSAGESLLAVWKEYLTPGSPLQARVTVPAHLSAAEFDATVVHAHAVRDIAVDVGIRFENLTQAQEKKIASALVAIAAERLRGHRPPMRIFEDTAREERPRLMPESLQGLRLGEILVHMGKLSQAEVDEAQGKASNRKLGRYLLESGRITPEELCRALSIQSGLPMIDLMHRDVPPELRGIFKYLQLRQLLFVPFQASRELLCIAAIHPLRVQAVKELERICGKQVLVFLGQEDLIHDLIFRLRPKALRAARRFARYKAAYPVYFQFCTAGGSPMGSRLRQGASLDVSEGGFSVEGEASEACAAGNHALRGMRVRLAVVLGGRTIHAMCTLRFLKHTPNKQPRGFPWLYGFQISKMEDLDRKRLRELCALAGISAKAQPRAKAK